MSNQAIEEQRKQIREHDERIAALANPQPPAPVPAPPSPDDQRLPSQEPAPASAGAAATIEAPGVPPPPAAPPEDVAALKAQIEALTNSEREARELFERQRGMIVPLQRKTSEQETKIRDLVQQVEDLKSAVQAPAGPSATPPQVVQPGQMSEEELKEFKENYGDMIPGLNFLVEQALAKIKPQLERVMPVVESAEAQREKQEQAEAVARHLEPLRAKHPNAGDIVSSPEFKAWVDSHPPFARSSLYDRISKPEMYQIGEIISIFDEYVKGATPPPPPPAVPSPGEMAVAARGIRTSATPGGSSEPTRMTPERHAFLNTALTRKRSEYTPDQLSGFRKELDDEMVKAVGSGRGLVASAAPYN